MIAVQEHEIPPQVVVGRAGMMNITIVVVIGRRVENDCG
jgi:hypothetical protein